MNDDVGSHLREVGCEVVDCINLPQDRVTKWQVFVNFQVLQKEDYYFMELII